MLGFDDLLLGPQPPQQNNSTNTNQVSFDDLLKGNVPQQTTQKTGGFDFTL